MEVNETANGKAEMEPGEGRPPYVPDAPVPQSPYVDANHSLSAALRKRIAERSQFVLGKVTTNKWEHDADLDLEGHGHGKHGKNKVPLAATLYLAFQALGVVYGDIGTSPLYTFAGTFEGITATPSDIEGVASLIVYSLTLLVLVKYSIIVLRANDHGNGGTFALYSILKRAGDFRTFGQASAQDRELSNYGQVGSGKFAVRSGSTTDWRQKLIQNSKVQYVIRILVVIGVGAIMGDGVLTPAITVISACEGIQQADPSFTRGAIVGIALAILVGLFLIQRWGTGKIGGFFSPIVATWLIFNSILGLINIFKHNPGIFKVFGPNYWMSFFIRNGSQGWRQLGGVLLCITGAEALYADLGHFSQEAILISTTSLVYPSLIITYLGQAAYLTKHPEEVENAFWAALPHGTFWPMFVVATLAAIVASQAMISAVFQVVYQAIAQDFFPRFHVKHTSQKVVGQVYIPVVNYVLMALTVIVVAIFQRSAKLGQAYGLAVIGDMLLTTHFMTLVMVCVWRLPLVLPAIFYLLYLLVEGVFLSASVEKIPKGGWFSIMMAGFYASVMLLWFAGTSRKRRYYTDKIIGKYRALTDLLGLGTAVGTADQENASVTDRLCLVQSGIEVHRSPGIGLYYSEQTHGIPPVMIQHLKNFPVVHQVNVFITNRFVPIPHVTEDERVLVNQLGVPGFYHAVVRYGYMDRINQDNAFIDKFLKDNVLDLLYQALFYNLSVSQSLRQEVLPAEAEETMGFNNGTIFFHQNSTKMSGIMSPPAKDSGSGRHHKTVTFGDSAHAVPEDKEVSGHEMNEYSVNANLNALSMNQTDLNQFSHQYTVSTAFPRGHPARRFRPIAIDQPQRQILDEVAAKLLDESATLLQKRGVEKVQRAVQLSHEIAIIHKAQQDKEMVYVFARPHMRLRKDTSWFRKIFLELPYETMVNNVADDTYRFANVPEEQLCEIGLIYEV